MRTPKLADSIGALSTSLPSSPTSIQTGCSYSQPTARTLFRESINPVCCMSSTARFSQYESAAQIDTPSSSFESRIRVSSGSLDNGQRSPSLVVISGRAAMCRTPEIFRAVISSEPLGPAGSGTGLHRDRKFGQECRQCGIYRFWVFDVSDMPGAVDHNMSAIRDCVSCLG